MTPPSTITRSRGPGSRSPAGAKRSDGSAQERFARHVRARRRRTWRVVALGLALAAVLLGVWWVLWRSDWMLVEQVEVAGAEPRWHAEILAAADLGISQPMVQVDTEAAAARVAEVPIVREVEVVRSWPSTVAVRVTEREPVLAVPQGSGRVALVDEEGMTVDLVSRPPEGLTVVLARGAAGTSPEALRAAWGVLSSLPDDIAAQVTTATVSSAALVSLELGERTVVWGGPQDSELKAEVLGALLDTEAVHIDVSAPRSPVTRAE